MTSPEQNDSDSQQDDQGSGVPTANPAYATPPPEGIPDADNT
jgi:hypothetical protein